MLGSLLSRAGLRLLSGTVALALAGAWWLSSRPPADTPDAVRRGFRSGTASRSAGAGSGAATRAMAVDRALLDLLAIADPAQRVAALHAWFRANLPGRLSDLRALFERMHEQSNPDLFTAFQAFLEEWGAIDGASAYRFAYDSPERSGIDGYAEFAVRGWQRADFDGLWRFVQTQQAQLAADDDRARWLVTWFTEALMDTDPDRFFAWTEAAGGGMSPRLREEITRTAAFHATNETIERVGEWLRRNEQRVTIGEVVGEFTRRYVEMKPAQASRWATALGDPTQRGAAAVVVARGLAAQDYELGVQWLAKPEVMHALRGAQAQWRAGEKPASAYDAAVAEYLSTLARHHGDDPRMLQAAEASVATVADPEVRKYLTARIDEVRVTYFGRPTQ